MRNGVVEIASVDLRLVDVSTSVFLDLAPMAVAEAGHSVHIEAAGLREVCRLVRRAQGKEKDDQAVLLAKAD